MQKQREGEPQTHTYTYIHTYIYTYIHTERERERERERLRYIYVYIYIYIYTFYKYKHLLDNISFFVEANDAQTVNHHIRGSRYTEQTPNISTRHESHFMNRYIWAFFCRKYYSYHPITSYFMLPRYCHKKKACDGKITFQNDWPYKRKIGAKQYKRAGEIIAHKAVAAILT